MVVKSCISICINVKIYMKNMYIFVLRAILGKLRTYDGIYITSNFHLYVYTLLNRLYGVWQRDLFTWYFRFQSTYNRNKFVWFSRWISGFCITKSRKECHWTAFYPPNTLKEREYNFPVVRMFLREFSHKQCAETSVHRATHHAVTKMTIVNFLVKVLQHNLNKQF